MEVRKQVQRFAEVMERKLQENSYKGGWRECPDDYLISRVIQELGEFLNCHYDSDLAHDLIYLDEAADVANFLMMLCDNRGALTSGRG